MWCFTPCVYNDQLAIVCFHKERYWYNEPFEVPISAVIVSADHQPMHLIKSSGVNWQQLILIFLLLQCKAYFHYSDSSWA